MKIISHLNTFSGCNMVFTELPPIEHLQCYKILSIISAPVESNIFVVYKVTRSVTNLNNPFAFTSNLAED